MENILFGQTGGKNNDDDDDHKHLRANLTLDFTAGRFSLLRDAPSDFSMSAMPMPKGLNQH